MRVQDALEQLDFIHEHLTRTEVYRGIRVPGVALVGVTGILAAAIQSDISDAQNPTVFVVYWLVVALIGGLLGGATAAHAYAWVEDTFARQRTRQVFAQFTPCLFAGGILTATCLRAGSELIPYLPGLWAVIFGLGLISARPYLPRGIGLVGFSYILAGAVLFARARTISELSGWTVGGVFGAGHLITAWVFWRDRSRDIDE